MAQQAFSLYAANGYQYHAADKLVIEIGSTHLACMLVNASSQIIAFELYTYTAKKFADSTALFAEITAASAFLKEDYTRCHLIINNHEFLLIPSSKFTKEMAGHYLNMLCGEDTDFVMHFDHLPLSPDMINAYRVPQAFNSIKFLANKSVSKHAASCILNDFLGQQLQAVDCINLQFYPAQISVAVLRNNQFVFHRFFDYETAEDAMYILLNTCTQLELNPAKTTIQFSGLIDIDSSVYREINALFQTVTTAQIKDSVAFNTANYPLHYFTPFINAALCV